jgi:hypothetical protein
MDLLGRLFGPAMGGWAVQEMATCSRYVAARLDQRIAHNQTIWNTHAA